MGVNIMVDETQEMQKEISVFEANRGIGKDCKELKGFMDFLSKDPKGRIYRSGNVQDRGIF